MNKTLPGHLRYPVENHFYCERERLEDPPWAENPIPIPTMEEAIAFLGALPKVEDLPAWLTERPVEAFKQMTGKTPEEFDRECDESIKRFRQGQALVKVEKGLDLKKAASSPDQLLPEQLGTALWDQFTHPAIQQVTINKKGARITWRVLQLLLLLAKKYCGRLGADPTISLPFLKAGETYETKEEVVAAVTDLVLYGQRYRQSPPIIYFSANDFRHHIEKFKNYSVKRLQEIVDEANAVPFTYKTARIEIRGEEGERYYIIPGRLVTIVTEVRERTKREKGQRAKEEVIWNLVCKDPFMLSLLNDIHRK